MSTIVPHRKPMLVLDLHGLCLISIKQRNLWSQNCLNVYLFFRFVHCTLYVYVCCSVSGLSSLFVCFDWISFRFLFRCSRVKRNLSNDHDVSRSEQENKMTKHQKIRTVAKSKKRKKKKKQQSGRVNLFLSSNGMCHVSIIHTVLCSRESKCRI